MPTPTSSSARRSKGQRGESIAAAALRQAGYEIVAQNWHGPSGELDLVARQGDKLVFVEVRARYDGIDAALESISAIKQRRLMRLAEEYVLAHDLGDTPYRIDVVAVGLHVSPPQVEIIEDAVGW